MGAGAVVVGGMVASCGRLSASGQPLAAPPTLPAATSRRPSLCPASESGPCFVGLHHFLGLYYGLESKTRNVCGTSNKDADEALLFVIVTVSFNLVSK